MTPPRTRPRRPGLRDARARVQCGPRGQDVADLRWGAYDQDMARLVLTLIGDDRAGLVRALSDVVAAHDGNWEESQVAELAGKFAGLVVASVPDERVGELTAALAGLKGLLDVATHPTSAEPRAAGTGGDGAESARRITIHLLGNDRPGIVREVSRTLADLGLSIDRMETRTREAPMAGGRLFEAKLQVAVPEGTDPADARRALERLAAEILVDLTVDDEQAPTA